MSVNPEKWGMFTKHLKIMKAVNAFTSYCMIRNIMKARSFRTVFWMVPTSLLAVANYKNQKQIARIVDSIVLHDDGRHVDLKFFDNSKIDMLDIACLSILNPD